MIKFFTELRRRNVFRVAGTYVVAAWFITQTSFTLEGVMNLPEWFDTLVFAIGVLGFPIAMGLAWVFELTPEGFKRTEVIGPNSIAEETGKKLDIAILIGLIAVVGLLVFSIARSASGTKILSVDGRSVAVLPFENRSPDAANAFFADGIHDELLTSLSKVPGLDVISRTSVMGYRSTEKRIPQIADELGAAAVLEGAVAKSGDRVRVMVQLIDGKNDTHIWAENYDRELSTDSLFDIQSEITAVISEALRDVLGVSSKTVSAAVRDGQAPSVDAYEFFIRANLNNQPGEDKEEDLRAAVSDYSRAIAIEPNYAAAHARKAHALLALYWFHDKEQADLDQARQALDRARALDPQSADVNLSEAFYQYWGLSDYRTANAFFDQTLKAAPGNVDALAGKAFIVRRLGDFRSAAAQMEKAHRLDPLSYYLIPELALTYAFLGNFEDAENMMAKAYQIDPDSLQGHGFGAAVSQFSGDAETAYLRFAPLAQYAPYEMVNYAIATRDADKVRVELSRWPEQQRQSDRDRIKYIMSQLRATAILGLSDIEIENLKSDLRALYNPALGWDDDVPDHFILIPAFLGDTDVVSRIAESYGNRNTDNSFAAFADYADIAEAYARIGQPEKAIDFLEKMAAMTSPEIGRLLEMEPALDVLRDHPRYEMLFVKG